MAKMTNRHYREIKQIFQQSYMKVPKGLTPEEVEKFNLLSCVPTSMFMLMLSAGHFANKDKQKAYDTYRDKLNWDDFNQDIGGWIRSRLLKQLRRRYKNFEAVAWKPGGNINITDEDIQNMVDIGYLSTDREVRFFKKRVMDQNPRSLVEAGYPLLVSVRPGFGANKQGHGIIVVKWTDKEVVIFDPDKRNPRKIYSPKMLEEYINPTGSFTIVLPIKKPKATEATT